jgi:hypothetical protein
MSKRVLTIGLAVAAALITLQGGIAQAACSGGWCYFRPPGTWYYYGSIESCATVVHVRNPERFGARLACTIEVTKVESLCYNPNSHNVVPGEAATQVIFSAANGIGSGDLVSKSQKNKNTAALCASVTSADADCELNPENALCDSKYCVNPNWNIKLVLTSEFRADCQTQACSGTVDDSGNCVGGDWVTKDSQSCECTLPPPYSIENPPEHCENPLDPGPECTAYECWELDEYGGRTGNMCALQ